MTIGAGAGAGAAVDGWDADAVHDEAGVEGGSEAGGGAEHALREGEAGSAASARVGVAAGGSGSGGGVQARASVEEALVRGATRDALPPAQAPAGAGGATGRGPCGAGSGARGAGDAEAAGASGDGVAKVKPDRARGLTPSRRGAAGVVTVGGVGGVAAAASARRAALAGVVAVVTVGGPRRLELPMIAAAPEVSKTATRSATRTRAAGWASRMH